LQLARRELPLLLDVGLETSENLEDGTSISNLPGVV